METKPEGWTTVAGGKSAEYAASELVNIPVGKTIYAIWSAAESLNLFFTVFAFGRGRNP
ncbi:MAG: hypothetical protein IJY62_02710 [Clostridia bacterium]|nr:hypothetical protein [Clostridia bacterium]